MPVTVPETAAPPLAGRRRLVSLPGETAFLRKLAIVAALALATLVPNLLISGLIEERQARQDGVEQDFAKLWGPAQVLDGPVLIIPYVYPGGSSRRYLEVSPSRLALAADLAPQHRRRGPFEATLYDAKVQMEGEFLIPEASRLSRLVPEGNTRFLWNEAFLSLGSETRLAGLEKEDHATINGSDIPWEACRDDEGQAGECRGASTIMASAPLDPAPAGSTKMTFSAAVSLRGTGAFKFLYVGRDLDATFRSPWRTPSFGGDTLPVNATVTPKGFEARWQISDIGASPIAPAGTGFYPPAWTGSTIGVDLLEAVPTYRMIDRVAKYGLLFVILAFAIYLFFEMLSRLHIHIVQYGLLGLSLCLFPLLLLSLSEPMGYTAGYGVSAGLVLLQSSLYTLSVAERPKPALLFAGMLAGLFGFIYVLLGLETYSLLLGTLALFVAISALMALTQKLRRPLPQP